MNQKLKKWIKWLDVIHDEVQQLVIDKDIFCSVQRLIKENKKIQKPSSFYKYLGDTYISHSVIGVRRQLKADKQCISFARLLGEIANNPELITRKYYCDLYTGSVVADLANKHFDRYCKSPGDNHISEKMAIDDLNEIRLNSKKVEDFADKRIAHRDKRDPKELPIFKEVDDLIDLLDRLYVKYRLLFHAESMESLLPTYQYDWQQIFDHPWR